MAMTLRLANFLLFCIGTLVSSQEQDLCDVFMAPSKIAGGGYGAYAARSFQPNEIVEMAPLFLPMVHDSPLLMNTVLNDYHYGYRSIHSEETMGVVLLGKCMFYNHSPEPNLLWSTNIGRGEPSEADPDSVGTAVFVAKRYIEQGEELFSSYGLEDGGRSWFEARRIPMADNVADSNITVDEMDRYRRDYCTKSFAGIGSDTYNNRIKSGNKQVYKLNVERLPVKDAPSAVAKVSITNGERVEIAPALVLSREMVMGTAIAPLCFFWQDLTEEHHEALLELREGGRLKVQQQGHDTQWHRRDFFPSFQDVVIFAAAGNVALIERVADSNDANCEMKIRSSGPESEGAGLVLEVIAIKDIHAGEALRLNIVPTDSTEEKLAFVGILEQTGQPMSSSLQALRGHMDNDEL
jgi:hypothetical protein